MSNKPVKSHQKLQFKKSINYKHILLLIILCIPGILMAQIRGNIKGKIIESDSLNPISYSSVALYSLPDSTLVKGVISDDKGDFLFSYIPAGNYYIIVNFLGYENTLKNHITINSEGQTYEVGSIGLRKKSVELEGVEIKGQMFKATEEVDRTVYLVNEQMASTSHSSLEMLRQVPTVGVDFQNNITINGSSNILIFVDGKQRDGEYLSQLNPASLQKIEVLDNPSSKYSADVSAVLNIITKKEARAGITGRIETEIPIQYQTVSNNSANIEYGYKNLRFFVSDNFHYERFEDMTFDTYRESYSDDDISILDQKGTGNGAFTYHKFHYGMDWFINDKNSFSFYGNYRVPLFKDGYDMVTTNELSVNDSITNFFKTGNEQQNHNVSHYYSLFYKRSYSTPLQELTMDISYSDYKGSVDLSSVIDYFETDRITPTGASILRNETTKNKKETFRTKIDYIQPLNKTLKLETGYQGEIHWYDNKFYISNEFPDDLLEYREVRNAGYVSMAGKVKEFSFQAGLRGENADILINSDTTIGYFCLLPQFNLQRKFGKTNSLKLSYRKSIKRPGIDQLNPFVSYSDSLNITRGNPELKPSYKHKLELSYTKNIKQNYISPSIYMLYFDDMFNSIITVNKDNVSEQYTDNVGKGYEYGFKVTGAFQVYKWWRLNADLTMFYKTLTGDRNASEYDIPDQDIYCWRGGLTSLMFFPKDISLIFFGRYKSPNIDPQLTQSRSPVYIVALQKGLMKKKAQISIFSYLPFWKEFIANKSEYKGSDFTQTSTVSIYPKTLCTVRLSYKFNRGEKVKKINREKETEEEGQGGLF